MGAIRFTRRIAAPLDIVWRVITDLEQYPEWNPFVVAATSTLTVGDPILMRVKLFPFLVQPQRETILDCVPGSRLCWGVAGHESSPIRSRRCQEIYAEDPRQTHYVSDFALDGWIAPLVMGLLGRRLSAGFLAMTDALQARAEAQAGAAGDAR